MRLSFTICNQFEHCFCCSVLQLKFQFSGIVSRSLFKMINLYSVNGIHAIGTVLTVNEGILVNISTDTKEKPAIKMREAIIIIISIICNMLCNIIGEITYIVGSIAILLNDIVCLKWSWISNSESRKEREREKREKGIFSWRKGIHKANPFHATCFPSTEKSNSHTHTCMHIINIYCIVYYGAIKSYQWNARYLCASFRLNWGPAQCTRTHILDETTIGNGWNKSYVRILNWP